MKRALVLSATIFAFILTVNAQQGNSFKSVTKKTSGTANVQLNAFSAQPSALKSGTGGLVNAYAVSPTLQSPGNLSAEVTRFFEKEKPALKSGTVQTAEEQFYAFHTTWKSITKLTNPKQELKITNNFTDELGIANIKAQQYYKGIKVHGAESYVHIGLGKDVYNGFIYKFKQDVDTIPSLGETDALRIVNDHLAAKTAVKELTNVQKEILNYGQPNIELVIYEGALAYDITVRPNFLEEWKYIVDAEDGAIVTYFNNTHSDGPATASALDLNNVLRTIDTYLENGTYYMINTSENMYNANSQEGIIYTFDANNTSTVDLEYTNITSANNTWSNPTAVSAHYSAQAMYSYLENTFGRNSINGQGGNIISFINVANEDGTSMENAFWNGQAAFYGNGGSAFLPLAGALDVISHELGHGVVSNTANLEYYGQSGAINESYADIFGVMVDRDDWLIGEDVTRTSYSPSGALRNMEDPHNLGGSLNDHFWQPKHVSEMYLGSEDNGGVHINSGIPNHAYYLFATAVSKEKAEQVFYRALTNYLTSKSQFIDLRIAVVQSAKDLYGENSAEAEAVGNAFDAVGIYDEESIEYVHDYEVNPGEEYLFTYDVNLLDSNTLYRSSAEGTDFFALTTTEMKSTVSVSDDGTAAVFVAADDRIKILSTDPDNIQEFYFSDEAFFDNVAVSKDGNRLAAISNEIDTAIYVYDFDMGQWMKFPLYNPTTSHDGTDAGGVLFADAIEFDHTGEYVMYDAFNELNSSFGDDISYWDIGFMKVWDNATNSFGDGTVSKLYGSLPENVSIGNPTFAKNSPNIIAFDYIDIETGEYAIFGANTLTGDLGLITVNATIGYPNFSKNDDKIAYSALNMSNEEVVATISLAADKINGIGSGAIVVNDARWPVFYAVGVRSLELLPVANFTADARSGEAPLTVQFLDASVNDPLTWSWTFQGGTPAASSEQNPTVSYTSSGTYAVTLTCTNNAGSNTITKNGYITVSGLPAYADEPKFDFSLFPNPTSDIIHIQSNQNYSCELYSTSGSLLMSAENVKVLDVSTFSEGIYFLHVKFDDRIEVRKIVKE